MVVCVPRMQALKGNSVTPKENSEAVPATVNSKLCDLSHLATVLSSWENEACRSMGRRQIRKSQETCHNHL